jgi:hypothetical protein
LKKNGKDSKGILPYRHGLQAYIDHLFWFLPFSSPKQAHEMLAKKELSDENWTTKREEVQAEHLLPQAAEDLRKGWKTWIKKNWSGKEGPGAAPKLPATGVTSVVRK